MYVHVHVCVGKSEQESIKDNGKKQRRNNGTKCRIFEKISNAIKVPY